MRRVFVALLALALVITPIFNTASQGRIAGAQELLSATTTDTLNLRTQAGMSGTVILVIPRGANVVVRGIEQNSFVPVTYQGSQGWAHADYLSMPKPAGSPGETGTVTEDLNLRIGPSTGQRAIMVLPAGAKVTITGTSSNNYLAITYGGYSGYAHKDWINASSTPPPVVTPTPGNTTGTNGKVTESLNLRSQPNTTYVVLTVMPAGADISLTGEVSGEFVQLTFGGRTGWAHRSWIRSADLPAAPAKPVAPPVTSISGPATVTEDLNLRAQANTSSAIVRVLPAGTTVQMTGSMSGSFYQVKHNNQTGWVHKDWIQQGEVTVIPTSTARVTESVNLRGGPATSYAQITVIPAGVTVTLTGQQSNGFHSVAYKGVSGWAFSTYLALNDSKPTEPVIPPGSVETKPEEYPPIETNLGFHYTNSIVGPTRGTPDQAIAYAKKMKSYHLEDVELYVNEVYRLAPIIGFDPSLIVAQSALETGYWRSKWWNERLNPAGLGINDNPSTHPYSQKFPNGTIAARAQLAHMHAEVFGNRETLPKVLQGVDVTYQRVFQAGWAGTVVTLEDLSGTWATDPKYGWKITRVAANIFG